jgi:hypothetical protein
MSETTSFAELAELFFFFFRSFRSQSTHQPQSTINQQSTTTKTMNDFTIRDAHDADFDDAYSDSEGAESTSRAESTSTTASAASISPSLRKKISRMRGKILFNGDGSAGKTCFLIRATSGQFPTDYVPTVLADYSANIRCNKYDVILNILLWDTFGRSDYDRLRPLSYPGTDLMVLCFDVTSRVQFDTSSPSTYPR